MRPSHDHIERTAYHRWERRGGGHGLDREDWLAAENDLYFALSYRWVARYRLSHESDSQPIWLGKDVALEPRRLRTCRFCERAEPDAEFAAPLALPRLLGDNTLRAWDQCADCRALWDKTYAAPFDAFAGPLVGREPRLPSVGATIPIAALEALWWIGLSLAPLEGLHEFGDAVEWVTNPDAARDCAILPRGLGCRVYLAPVAIPAPFASIARRCVKGADNFAPYMLFFLGFERVVMQTHLPLCPRDEELDDDAASARVLSMSIGSEGSYQASPSVFLPVEPGTRSPRSATNGAR
jgi:hypothetical protein